VSCASTRLSAVHQQEAEVDKFLQQVQAVQENLGYNIMAQAGISIRIVFHTVFFYAYLFGLYLLPPGPDGAYSMYLMFATVWGVIAQTIYFFFWLISDIKEIFPEQAKATPALPIPSDSTSPTPKATITEIEKEEKNVDSKQKKHKSATRNANTNPTNTTQKPANNETNPLLSNLRGPPPVYTGDISGMILHCIYRGVCAPVGMSICVTFWAFYYYDKNLVFPAAFERYYSPLLVHMHYTLPFIVNLLDGVIINHNYKKSIPMLDMSLVFVLGFVYMCTLLGSRLTTGRWREVYINLSPTHTVVLVATFFASCLIFYKLMTVINSAVWNNRKEKKTEKNKEE